MGNRAPVGCSCNTQRCADELGFSHGEDQPARDPDCDPAGTVFNETLEGLVPLEQEAMRFAGTSNLAAVRWLLAMGANVNAKDSLGTSMLHTACRSGSCPIVLELVLHRAQLGSTDSSGWTPLHIAAVMGRRHLVALLLRHGADAAVQNERGATPAAVCTDPGTRDVFKGFNFSSLLEVPASDSKGGVRGDASDRTTCCVPFFVPRQPLFRELGRHAELASLCSEMLDRSVGHGLAFCVATGVVKDRPMDLSHFLLEQRTSPVKLGEFLGEELSMSETLRLAFMDSMDLFNTGVVGALCRAFRHVQAPRNFGKIDRLTTAVAHMWWRAHDVMDEMSEDESSITGEGGLGRILDSELSGMGLRRHIRSVEGLQRLMFSTVMLYWCIHGSSISFPPAASVEPRHLSLSGWIDINVGIDIDGTSVPQPVLEGIFSALTEQVSMNLLPAKQPLSPPLPAPLVEKAEASVQSWAFIPPGGLERYEQAVAGGAGCVHTPHLAQCILSEHSPTPAMTPRIPAERGVPVHASVTGETDAEAVWLSLRFSLILFLANSPTDPAPYAFLKLTDAVLRDTDRHSRQIVLAGRPRAVAAECKGRAQSEEGLAADLWSPFGDISRDPLQLCFLLRDGRFQPFSTLWLELRFSSDEDMDLWVREFGSACFSPHGPPSAREPDRGVSADVGSPRTTTRAASPRSPAAHPRLHQPPGPVPRMMDSFPGGPEEEERSSQVCSSESPSRRTRPAARPARPESTSDAAAATSPPAPRKVRSGRIMSNYV